MLLGIFEAYGQLEKADNIELRLVDSKDSLARYAFFPDEVISLNDLNALRLIWELESVRKVATGLSSITVDMETFTIILNRPSGSDPYYQIGLYERQTQTLNKLMIYRVDKNLQTIEKKQDWETKWTKVNR